MIKKLLKILNEEVSKKILTERFLFPIGSDKFNIGYDDTTMGKDTVLDKDNAIHNSDYGKGDLKHQKRGGHKGIDIFAPKGTPLVSCVDGVITKMRKNNRVGGNTITITDNNGLNYYYAHLDSLNPSLKIKDIVNIGEFLGTVGDSGRAKGTHPHLHFSIYDKRGYNRGSINPWPFLKASVGSLKTIDTLSPELKDLMVTGGGKDLKISDLSKLNKNTKISDILDYGDNTELISRGERGENVEELQKILVNLGYDLGDFGPNKDGIDGLFGPKTKEAIKKFQKDNNLSVDGIVGIETATALSEYL